MTVEQVSKDSQSLINIQECVMIANIRTFDYSHDVQFKVCTIIMLNATSLIQPPKTTSTHNVLHISYKDAFTQTQHRLCFPLHPFTDPHPDRPYTHPYTDEPHPSWSSTHKRTVEAVAPVCMSVYAGQCVLFALSCQTASRYDPADVSALACYRRYSLRLPTVHSCTFL